MTLVVYILFMCVCSVHDRVCIDVFFPNKIYNVFYCEMIHCIRRCCDYR